MTSYVSLSNERRVWSTTETDMTALAEVSSGIEGSRELARMLTSILNCGLFQSAAAQRPKILRDSGIRVPARVLQPALLRRLRPRYCPGRRQKQHSRGKTDFLSDAPRHSLPAVAHGYRCTTQPWFHGGEGRSCGCPRSSLSLSEGRSRNCALRRQSWPFNM